MASKKKIVRKSTPRTTNGETTDQDVIDAFIKKRRKPLTGPQLRHHDGNIYMRESDRLLGTWHHTDGHKAAALLQEPHPYKGNEEMAGNIVRSVARSGKVFFMVPNAQARNDFDHLNNVGAMIDYSKQMEQKTPIQVKCWDVLRIMIDKYLAIFLPEIKEKMDATGGNCSILVL